MTNATYELMVDLDQSALFDVDEDVTADVIAAAGSPLISTERGHDLNRVLSPPIAGSMGFILTGDYSPGGDLKAGREVRLRTTFDAVEYPVWRGFLDHPVQTPPGADVKWTTVQCFGNLARLAGRKVSTALYQDITTGEAIEVLLDAAGFQKNLQGYLDDLSPVGGWNLASTSGDDPDTSGNGNNLTVFDAGAGVRGAAAIDDSGTLSWEFPGTVTTLLVNAAPEIAELFATGNGGLLFAIFVADSDGQSDEGTIVSKGTYRLYVADESGGAMRLRYTYDWGSVDGLWETTSRVVTVGKPYGVAVTYSRANSNNNPTMWLIDIEAGTLSTLTVGSGLTESASPAGPGVGDDTSNDLIIGNIAASTRTFDGRIGTVRLYADQGDAAYWTPLLSRAAAIASAAPRHIDTGQTDIDWWWLDNEDALAALEILKNSEGPGAALYEDAQGGVVFKNRHARNTETRSTTIQTTFNTGSGAEPRIGTPFDYTPGLKDVVNECEIDTVRREAQSLAEVWALGETFSLGPGETKMFVARNSSGDPFTAAVTPSTGGGDYTVVSGSVAAVSLDRTSGPQVVISMTGGAAGASISGLRLRAQLVTVVNSSRAANTIDTSASKAEFGTHSYRLQVRPEIGFNLAQDFCNALVSYYQDGRPTASITLANNMADERMQAGLEREVGDRVRVIVGTELDQEMYVEHIRHDVYAPMHHVTTLGLTQAQGLVSYFTLDESVLDGDDVLAF